MNTPKWTTAPWSVIRTAMGFAVNAINLRVARLAGDPHEDPEVEANARLIAAAPELYEGLRQNNILLRSILGMVGTPFERDIDKQIDGNDLVLAKARGEATPS